MSERIQEALTELSKLPSNKEALAVILALSEKRKKHHFIKYWEATKPEADIIRQFTSDIKIFGILGGNRSGKTELGAFISVAWALGKEYFRDEPAWEYIKDLPIPDHKCNIWVVGLDFPTMRDVIWREKLRFGKNHPSFVPKDTTIVKKITDSEYQIFFENGSIITGKSADSGREKFQGASVDLVWIDEEPEVDVYDECYQRTTDCEGKILITLTPLTDIASGARIPWVFDLYEDWKLGQKDVKFVQLSVMDNPYVSNEEKTKLKEKWTGHFEEKARLYGQFVQRSGLVYPTWDIKIHVVKHRAPPSHYYRIVSMDPAATGITAALWGAAAPNGDLYLYREYYERDMVVSDHAKNILALNGGERIDLWIIDPKWGSQRNAETHKTNMQLYKESGIPVRLASVGEDYGLNISREYINATTEQAPSHPKVFVFEDLWHFRDEIERYTWARFSQGPQKGLSKDKPVKRDDHLMNAFQYMCAYRPRGRRGQTELTLEEKKKQAELNSYT